MAKKKKKEINIDNRPKGVSRREFVAARKAEGRNPYAKFFSDPVADRNKAQALSAREKAQADAFIAQRTQQTQPQQPLPQSNGSFMNSLKATPWSQQPISQTPQYQDQQGQGVSYAPKVEQPRQITPEEKAQADEFIARTYGPNAKPTQNQDVMRQKFNQATPTISPQERAGKSLNTIADWTYRPITRTAGSTIATLTQPITGQDTYSSDSKMAKFIFGEAPITTYSKAGKDLGEGFNIKNPIAQAGISAALIGLDFIGYKFADKKKIAEAIAKNVIGDLGDNATKKQVIETAENMAKNKKVISEIVTGKKPQIAPTRTTMPVEPPKPKTPIQIPKEPSLIQEARKVSDSLSLYKKEKGIKDIIVEPTRKLSDGRQMYGAVNVMDNGERIVGIENANKSSVDEWVKSLGKSNLTEEEAKRLKVSYGTTWEEVVNPSVKQAEKVSIDASSKSYNQEQYIRTRFSETNRKLAELKQRVKDGGVVGKDELSLAELNVKRASKVYNEYYKSQPLQEGVTSSVRPQVPKATESLPAKKVENSLDNVSKSSLPETSTIPRKSQEPINMSSVRKFFTSGEKVLEKSGEGGKKLAKVMETQRKSEDLLRGRWNVHIDSALKGLSKEQLSNVDKVLRGEAKPMDARTAGASKSLRNWFNNIGKEAETKGFEIQNSSGTKTPFKMREDYAPQMYNFTDFQKGAMRETALDHLVKTGQARNKAEATRLLDDFIASNAERRFGNLEKAREIDLPGFERDPRVYAKKYAQSIAKRFSEVDNFGMKDANVAKYIDQIAQEGGDYNAAQKIFDYTTKGAPQNKVVSAITQYNLATQLDLSAITNATQSINTASKAGIINTVKGVAKSFTKKGKEVAELAGVYDDFIQSKEASVDLNKVVKMVMWPFQKVENFNRRLAANIGDVRATQLKDFLSGKPKQIGNKVLKGTLGEHYSKFAVRELKSLGIDVAETGRLSKDDMISAVYEMARKTQFKVDPLDVPTAWKTPAGKLAMQFQSFSFMQTKFIRDSILKEAAKGNFMPLVRFIPLAIAGSYAANYVRNLVTGRDPDQANKDMDIRAWDKWGKAFGDFATNKIIQGKFLYDTYNNDFNTPLKKVTRTLGSIGGPTVGKTGSMLNALEAVPNQMDKNKYLRKTGKEQDPYLEAKRFGAGEIPFIGEMLKNKKFSYPASTTTPERKAENTKVYDFADTINKLPYGDEKAKTQTKDYLENIPNEKERKRQAYILNQNGVDTFGISLSDDVIKGKKMIESGQKPKTNEEMKAYKAAETSIKSAKTRVITAKYTDLISKGVELSKQGKAKDVMGILEGLTNEEKTAIINSIKAKL